VKILKPVKPNRELQKIILGEARQTGFKGTFWDLIFKSKPKKRRRRKR